MIMNSGNERPPRSIKNPAIWGISLSIACLVSILLTLIFIYVSNDAKKQVDIIRKDYSKIADQRDHSVVELSGKVGGLTARVDDLQHKVDTLPAVTADKTADKVKRVVENGHDEDHK